LPEVNRIIRHTGKSVSSCFTVEGLTWEEHQEFVKKSDIFSQVFAGQARIRLNVLSEPGDSISACVFLKKGEGCSLPENIRPHSCRLYPFWFERKLEKGDDSDGASLTIINGMFPGMCYGRMLSKARGISKSEGEALLHLFNTNEEALLSVARKFLKDAYVHAKILKSSSIALGSK
jgi:Fe-S-cluster containining protein